MKLMSTNVKKQLKITLRSDLVSGSGIGWGSVIDTDITYDDFGFPYIPARRLRGLFKEALWELEQFGVKTVKSTALFGNEEEEGHFFKIYNAQLPFIEELHKEVTILGLNSIDVLSYYTNVRYQTSIDMKSGVASEKSLRSIRAIKKGLTFYAELECEKQDLQILKKCCALIKHMGTNRTRGFGEVTFTIEDYKKENNVQIDNMEDHQEYLVKLCLCNLTQLSVASTKGEQTCDYISGASILGYFANRYLKTHKADEHFYDLFVKGKVKFLNAYITDDEYHMSMPVRESLFKEKTGKTYFNKLIYETNIKDATIIMKKVRDKYIVNENILSPNKEMTYHHRRPLDKSIGHSVSNEKLEDGGFYQLQVLSAKQHFVSYIQGRGQDLKLILKDCPSHIQIGKSKATQYGNVEIVKAEVTQYSPKVIEEGQEVICTLLSPLVLLNRYLEADLTNDRLLEACCIQNNDSARSQVGYTEVGGYNAKWRLQKPTYHAFSKGTCIRGKLIKNVKEYECIGELQQEGNGILHYEVVNEHTKASFTMEEDYKVEKVENYIPTYSKDLYISYLKDKLELTLFGNAYAKPKPNINNTTLNKMIATLQQNSLEVTKLWLNNKIEASEGKKETKHQNQNSKFKVIKDFISDIEKECDKEFGSSELAKLLNGKEKDEYVKQLKVMTIRHYLIHHKRGDEQHA